jgi:hypothetical protein
MTTRKKIASNALNALQSTGPRTENGKAIASKNSRKHGLLSQHLLLPNESPEELAEFREHLWEDLRPEGAMEGFLVEDIVSAIWRLRRLQVIETEIFTWDYYEQLAEKASKEAASYEEMDYFPVSPTDKQKCAEARGRAQRATELQQESCTLGSAFVRVGEGSDAFSKLSRYETTLLRRFYRALHELKRLQADRAGINVPPPVAIDAGIAIASSLEESKRALEGDCKNVEINFAKRSQSSSVTGTPKFKEQPE